MSSPGGKDAGQGRFYTDVDRLFGPAAGLLSDPLGFVVGRVQMWAELSRVFGSHMFGGWHNTDGFRASMPTERAMVAFDPKGTALVVPCCGTCGPILAENVVPDYLDRHEGAWVGFGLVEARGWALHSPGVRVWAP